MELFPLLPIFFHLFLPGKRENRDKNGKFFLVFPFFNVILDEILNRSGKFWSKKTSGKAPGEGKPPRTPLLPHFPSFSLIFPRFPPFWGQFPTPGVDPGEVFRDFLGRSIDSRQYPGIWPRNRESADFWDGVFHPSPSFSLFPPQFFRTKIPFFPLPFPALRPPNPPQNSQIQGEKGKTRNQKCQIPHKSMREKILSSRKSPAGRRKAGKEGKISLKFPHSRHGNNS